MTTARSAYPVPVEDLLPRAHALVERLGAVPSRNQLMSEFRIGARKANTILTHLTSEPSQTGQAGTELRLVPEPEPDPAEGQHGIGENTLTEPLPVVPAVSEGSGTEPADVDPADEPTDPASTNTTTVRAIDHAYPDTGTAVVSGRRVRSWPVLLLALPAFVAIWSGWVGLGELTGFGLVHPLPGIADGFALNTAITLPIGVETYAAYALRVWLSGTVPEKARCFAKYSALGSLGLGALGQIAYHLMDAAGMNSAPWPITTAVSCLPVAVLGMGAALTHLIRDTHHSSEVAR